MLRSNSIAAYAHHLFLYDITLTPRFLLILAQSTSEARAAPVEGHRSISSPNKRPSDLSHRNTVCPSRSQNPTTKQDQLTRSHEFSGSFVHAMVFPSLKFSGPLRYRRLTLDSSKPRLLAALSHHPGSRSCKTCHQMRSKPKRSCHRDLSGAFAQR